MEVEIDGGQEVEGGQEVHNTASWVQRPKERVNNCKDNLSQGLATQMHPGSVGERCRSRMSKLHPPRAQPSTRVLDLLRRPGTRLAREPYPSAAYYWAPMSSLAYGGVGLFSSHKSFPLRVQSIPIKIGVSNLEVLIYQSLTFYISFGLRRLNASLC